MLSKKEFKSANENDVKCQAINTKTTDTHQKYNGYLAEERAQIGKYAAENSPTRASKLKALQQTFEEECSRAIC